MSGQNDIVPFISLENKRVIQSDVEKIKGKKASLIEGGGM